MDKVIRALSKSKKSKSRSTNPTEKPVEEEKKEVVWLASPDVGDYQPEVVWNPYRLKGRYSTENAVEETLFLPPELFSHILFER